MIATQRATTAPLLRIATPKDGALLAQMGRESFIENFAHLYAADDLQYFLETTYTQAIQTAELSDPTLTHWIVEINGEPAAFAKAGPCKLPVSDMPASAYELHRLYVLEPFQHLGLGSLLMNVFFTEAARHKATALYLGVWQKNTRAIAFYQRHGFEVSGAYHFPVGKQVDDEFIMRRGL